MLCSHPYRFLVPAGCLVLLGMAAPAEAQVSSGTSPAPGVAKPRSYPYPSYPPYPAAPMYGEPVPPAGSSVTSSPSPQAQPPPLPERKAFIRVFLPDGRAQVSFNGHPTTVTGASRLFETPRLQVGRTYTYTVKATWYERGRPVTQERHVTVIPGQYTMANFTMPPDSELVPAPEAGRY